MATTKSLWRKPFILIARAEGYSYLTLFFVAMPLKYMADLPMAVSIVGAVHGALFIAFLFWLLMTKLEQHWSFAFCCLAVLASLLPFGIHVIERHWPADRLNNSNDESAELNHGQVA